MRKFVFLSLIASVSLMSVISGSVLAQKPDGDNKLQTLKQKASYAIGVQIGNNFKMSDADLDLELVASGIADGFAGKDFKLTKEQMQQVLIAFNKQMGERLAAKSKKDAETNKVEGEAFLKANAKKPGVKVLPSGLQYKVIQQGDGATPNADDLVRAHYHGTLIDGTVFDSSIERMEPIVIGVDEVIKGWQEALQMMKVGSKWKLYVPSDLAYGANPRPGGPIGPNAVLIFDIELLAIEEKEN